MTKQVVNFSLNPPTNTVLLVLLVKSVVCFIMCTVTDLQCSTGQSEEEMWLKVTCEKLYYIISSVKISVWVSQIDFYLQWWLFSIDMDKPHNSVLLHKVIKLLFLFQLFLFNDL